MLRNGNNAVSKGTKFYFDWRNNNYLFFSWAFVYVRILALENRLNGIANSVDPDQPWFAFVVSLYYVSVNKFLHRSPFKHLCTPSDNFMNFSWMVHESFMNYSEKFIQFSLGYTMAIEIIVENGAFACKK